MVEINGDLIEMAKNGDFDVIAHGCNCFSIQNAGIAKQMNFVYNTALYPFEIATVNTMSKLGNIQFSSKPYYGDDLYSQFMIQRPLKVYNMYTQYYPGANLNINALILCLEKLNFECSPTTRIGLPRVGCGIAGGNWDEIKSIFKDIFKDKNLTIVWK
jgi:O-acetyl-ADP-ribose deacetylase (regulator of RNase III)